MSPDEIAAVIDALRLHQVELERQNEELRRAQAELQFSRDMHAVSEQRYRELYEFAPVGYLTLDPDRVVVEANLSATLLLRIPRAELLGRKFSDFVVPADQDRWYLQFRAAERGEPSRSLDLALERPDGGRVHVEASLIGSDESLPDAEVCVALVDVTVRRQTELALRMAAARELIADQRERRDLAEQLHGDVEQRLALLAMKVGALGEVPLGAGLAEITDDLSQLTLRVSAFGVELCPTMLFDLGIVAAAQWLSEDVERRHGVHVRVRPSEEIPDMDEVSRITLFRALYELVLNVVRHSGVQEGSIDLWQSGSRVHLEVEDSGAGFDPDAVQQGLGLLTIRTRIEHLGGRVEIHAAHGRGARVVVELPARLDGAGSNGSQS